MKQMVDEQAIERRFLETAQRRSEYLRRCDSKRANREFEKLERIKSKLRALPDRGKAILKRAVASTDDSEVLIEAAALLLPIDERAALKTLQRISNGNLGIPSFTASMTISEWKAGRLTKYLT
ncbi:MAG: hypothetical protein HYX26_03400 [Acidobacteriales bacterium]|nr:hypothetical protein [Terriglobales bacterium]